MNMTEQQLAELFQNNSKKHTSSSRPGDCLTASKASSKRLEHVENMLDDHSSAQGMKAALALENWSQVMAQSISNSQQSWFRLLGMKSPLKTAFATLSFAFAFAVALPQFTQFGTSAPTYLVETEQAHNDVITQLKFDAKSDRLSKGGFDRQQSHQQDGLFSASFG